MPELWRTADEPERGARAFRCSLRAMCWELLEIRKKLNFVEMIKNIEPTLRRVILPASPLCVCCISVNQSSSSETTEKERIVVVVSWTHTATTSRAEKVTKRPNKRKRCGRFRKWLDSRNWRFDHTPR